MQSTRSLLGLPICEKAEQSKKNARKPCHVCLLLPESQRDASDCQLLKHVCIPFQMRFLLISLTAEVIILRLFVKGQQGGESTKLLMSK